MTVRKGIQEFRPDATDSRHPVIVAGSNAAPSRLLAKYGGDLSASIPVQAAIIENYSAVYSSHFSTYGSVPATMEHDPGCQSHIHVVWLDGLQLEMMHETESLGTNYRYGLLEDLSLRLDDGQQLDSCAGYLSLRGPLRVNGRPTRLNDFISKNSTFLSNSQADMQEFCRSVLAPEKPLREFVLENIRDPVLRRDRMDQLRQYAGHPSCPAAKTIKT